MMSHTRLCLANMVTFLWRYDLDPFFVTVIHPLRPRLVPSRSNTLGKTVHRSGFKRFYLYSLHVSENGRLVALNQTWEKFTSVSVFIKHLKCFPEWLFPYQTDLVDEACPARNSRCYDIKSSIHLAGCRGKKEGKTPTLALVLYIAVSFLPKFPFIWSVFDNNLRLGIFRIVYEPSSHIAIQVRPQSDMSTTVMFQAFCCRLPDWCSFCRLRPLVWSSITTEGGCRLQQNE